MRCWLIIVPPVCIIVVGCFAPLLCCVDVLITVLCTFIDVVHWDSAVLHCVTWLSTLVTNNMSFSLSCWLPVGLSFSFVMLSFERHSLSNFSLSFCWLWTVVSVFFVDRSFRNLFLCCPSCLSCLCVFLFLFLCVFLCCLLLCPLVLLLHCSLLKLLMMDSAVTYWRLCVLFGIRWLLSVSPRMLVTLLHWGESVAAMVLLFCSSELPLWLDLVDLYCCLIHIVVSRIPSCWMILRNCWCQMLARAVWCSLFLVVFWIVGVVFCRSQVQSHVDTVYTWLRQLLL